LLEAVNVVSLDSGCIELVEVIGAELGVRPSGAQEVVDHDEQAMRYGDDGLLAPASPRHTLELRVEVRVAHLDGVPGDFTHDRS